MSKKMVSKKVIFLPIFLILLLCFNNTGHAAVLDKEAQKQPEYAPGQVIVKLKEGKNNKALFTQSYSVRSAAQNTLLSKLKGKYNLRDEKPVFQGLHNQLKGNNLTLEKLQAINAKSTVVLKNKLNSTQATDLLPIYILKTDQDVLATCEKLKQDPDIEYTEPNYIVRIQMVPNDPYYSSQGSWGQTYDDLWGIKKIQCEQAWGMSQGEGAVVAVIDTGVDYNHPDLAANIWTNSDEVPDNGIDDDGNGYVDDVQGYDFCTIEQVLPDKTVILKPRDSNPIDGSGHGTHVSGTIAAVGDNNIGVIGVAPRAKIMAVKGLSDDGYGFTSDLADCVTYAADNGAKVLNNSWGGAEESQLLIDVFHYADQKGCVAIAASGNSSNDVKYYMPANIDTVLAVSASSQKDTVCFFSNWGDKIAVSAPGGGFYFNSLYPTSLYNILSTMSDTSNLAQQRGDLKVSNGYYLLAGTSMACPHVSGVAALLVSQNPTLTPEEVRTTIESSADDIETMGWDDISGYGRLNAYRACDMGAAAIFITSPIDKSYIKSDVSVLGSAHVKNGFQSYRIYYAQKDNPNDVTEIAFSANPVINGELGVWHTADVKDGVYLLSLEVIYKEGSTRVVKSKELTIDNVNDPPVFVNLNNIQIVGEGTKSVFDIKAIDPDDPATPEGQLSYSASNLPPNARLVISDGRVMFQWDNAPKGSYKTTFTVSDNQNAVSKDVIFSTMQFEIIDYIETEGLIAEVAMYGDKVVWISHFGQEDEGEQDYTNDYDEIYMYDLSSSTKIKLNERATIKFSPSIYENKIIWSELRYPAGTNPNYEDIYEYIYDPANPQEIKLIVSNSSKSFPEIYNDKIVWSDNRNNQNGIFIYDGINEEQIASCRQGLPVGIYGDNIVWQDWNDLGQWGHELYLCRYAPNGSDIRKIADYDVLINGFAIYENKIVWIDERPMTGHDNVYGVYLYDILTGEEKFLTTGQGAMYPDIYQDKIVWAEYVPQFAQAPAAIYIYDLAKSMKIPIQNIFSDGTYPTIYEDKIAYVVRNPDMADVIRVGRPHFRGKITQPPVLDPIGDKTIDECQRLEFNVRANGPVYLFAENLPTGAQFTDNSDGTALFHWFPRDDQAGIYKVTLTATDGTISGSETIAITVNDVPPPSPPHDLTATANSHSSITISWQYDNPSSIHGFQVFMRRSDNPPDYWSVIDNPMPSTSTTYSRTYSWLQPNKTYYFKVRAYKIGPIFSDYSNIASAISDRPPVLQNIGSKNIDENQSLTFIISATDLDNDSLTYSAVGLPQGAEFNRTTCLFSWMPTSEQAGTYNVTFTVSDGTLTDEETITIIVIDIHEYTVSLWGSISDYSTIKIYGTERIKITMSDGRVVEGRLDEYLYLVNPPSYWKIYIRSDFSLERFEIYQQQGTNKVLLAKHFYDGLNRIIADMSASPSPLGVGIKDYANFSKSILIIDTPNPTQVLIELTMENVGNYIHAWKEVYLYDIGQIFENIPLCASTDPQRLADQPIITLYYQNGENDTITSWRYKDMPDSVFIVNNGADILGLLTSIPDRNSDIINGIIQNGDDIRMIGEQTISLPARTVRVYFESPTGILRFYDATTYETVAEVKYPEFNRVLIDNIEYEITISDGVITLRPLNNPPDISQIPDSITKSEGDTIKAEEIELAVDPDKDTLIYTYSGWLDSLPHTIDYDDQGEHILHVEVSDGTESVGKAIIIKVNNVNRPPYIEPIDNQEIDENQTFTIIVTATDPDDDSLTYSAWDLPTGSTFDPETHTFTWTPTYEQAGYYKVFFEASDGNLSMNVGIPITVNDVNRAPFIEPVPDQIINEGERWAFQLKATDPDGDKLKFWFNITPDIRGLTLSDDGLLSWTPDFKQSGTYMLDLIVSDIPDHPEDYLKTYFQLKITVLSVNNHPEILYLRNYNNIYIMWRGYDKEDRYNLTYSYKVDEGSWSTPGRRTYIYIKELSQDLAPGTHIFHVKAMDTKGAESKPKSVEFTVIANTPPQMQYLTNVKNIYLTWLGYDKEDGYNLTYSYRIDGGKWSLPSSIRYIYIRNINVPKGKHLFEVKAMDKKGLESEIKSSVFIK